MYSMLFTPKSSAAVLWLSTSKRTTGSGACVSVSPALVQVTMPSG